jgi:hypothetical protein
MGEEAVVAGCVSVGEEEGTAAGGLGFGGWPVEVGRFQWRPV